MGDKKHLLNLRFGNKGFIFTIDILIAIVMIAIIMFASTIFVLKQTGQNIKLLQIEKIGADTIAVLDYRGYFNALDKNSIETRARKILPKNYDISLKMECQNITILIGGLPQRSFPAGERIIVTRNLDYCYVKYWTWEK